MNWLSLGAARRPPELVLFILWPNGRQHEPRVMRTILERFHPLAIQRCTWRAEDSRQRLAELYHRDPAHLFEKNSEVGAGPTSVVVALDYRPSYVWSKRKQGLANRNTYRLKMQERRRNGQNYLHASDTEHDAVQFAVRLLGKPTEHYLQLKETALQATARPPERSLRDVLQVLNDNVRYVVMRGWSSLPEGIAAANGDIDILVEDPAEVLALFPSVRKKQPESHRVRYHLFVCPFGNLLPVRRYYRIDIRQVGDSYYDEQWQREMLERRVYSPLGFYHVCDEDHFYAVLYHAFLHKPRLRENHREVLVSLGRSIPGWSDRFLDDPQRCIALLRQRGVPIQQPADTSVFWNSPLLAAG